MNLQLTAAGSLALLAAAIHGVAGELLVMRRLAPGALPPTALGGPRMTRTMVHVSWHLTTVAFLAVGAALLAAGTALDGDTARALGLVGAGASTGFAAVTLGLGAARLSPRALYRHPAPLVLTAGAALAWWGAL